jgi:hypothetical protein
MGTLNYSKLLTTLTALALGVSAAACGDDSGEKGPTGGPSINLDSGVPAIDSGLGNDATTNPVGNDGSVVVGADTGTPVVVNPGDCKGANGCYSCKPTPTITSPQLLNTCATGCREFDNTKRLPGGFNGTLPPLQ